MLGLSEKIKLCGYAIGIFVCFAIFGVLQEKIFRGRYGDEIAADGEKGERYTMPISFGAIQCIVFSLFAKGIHNNVITDISEIRKLVNLYSSTDIHT